MVYKNKKSICTIIIVGINVIVFLGLSFFGMTEDAEFMVNHGALYVPYVMDSQEYYRMFTSLFLHFGIAHLINNMLLLFVLGSTLESVIGKIKFLLLYLVAGLGGNVLSIWHSIQIGKYSVSAGASGAIFGIIGALLYIVIRNRGRVGTLTSKGMLFMIVISLYYGFTSAGIDNYAHIGGLITGVIMAILIYRKSQIQATKNDY